MKTILNKDQLTLRRVFLYILSAYYTDNEVCKKLIKGLKPVEKKELFRFITCVLKFDDKESKKIIKFFYDEC